MPVTFARRAARAFLQNLSQALVGPTFHLVQQTGTGHADMAKASDSLIRVTVVAGIITSMMITSGFRLIAVDVHTIGLPCRWKVLRATTAQGICWDSSPGQ